MGRSTKKGSTIDDACLLRVPVGRSMRVAVT